MSSRDIILLRLDLWTTDIRVDDLDGFLLEATRR
jgi:hypothetical protein